MPILFLEAVEEIPFASWAGFAALVGTLLLLDITVFHRRAHRVTVREAAAWTAFWVALAVGFGIWIHFRFGQKRSLEFFTGYLIEEALSVDNLFVFLAIFRYFAVKPEYQHRILFWGIIGAVVMRLGFVLAGAGLIHAFHWVIYILGAFLVVTGWKLLFHDVTDVDPSRNWALRIFRRTFRVTEDFDGPQFIVRRNGKNYATPLLLVLVVVETTDLMFAVDSVPAILAITTDTFIVFTSNVFAIMGLRSVYFLLAGIIDFFRFLKVGLSLILMFVGVKMLLSGWTGEIPVAYSLGVVAAILVTSVLMSVVIPRRRGMGVPEEPSRKIPREPPGEEA